MVFNFLSGIAFGDTNKATYVVQFFNLVIINCSIYLDYLSKNRKKLIILS